MTNNPYIRNNNTNNHDNDDDFTAMEGFSYADIAQYTVNGDYDDTMTNFTLDNNNNNNNNTVSTTPQLQSTPVPTSKGDNDEYEMDTDKISGSDDTTTSNIYTNTTVPPPSTVRRSKSAGSGSGTNNTASVVGLGSAASFLRNTLRRSVSHSNTNNNRTSTVDVPYDHRNSLIRSITTTAAATLERHYSVAELVQTLNHRDRYGGTNTANTGTTGTNQHHHHHDNNNGTDELQEHMIMSPELERRVLDFQLAQKKRQDKYGVQKPWGIFGMYTHLANVRIDLEWAEDAAYRRIHGEPYLSWTDFDDVRIKTLNRPYFTYIIVVLCTIMLIIEFAVNDWKIEPLSVNPMIGPSKDTLIKLGARDTSLIVNNNEWYRIIAPLILHAGIIHYIVNMLAIYFIGIAIEQNHGFIKSSILFIIPGIGGTILSAIFLPQYVSVGASGGIFGLIGSCIADIILHWNLLFIQVLDETPKQTRRRNIFAIALLVFEILFNILLGLITPFIDNFSHLGGMVYGMCCAFTTIETLSANKFFTDGIGRSTTFDKVRTFTIKFCGLIISITLIMVSTVYLATSPDPTQSPCSGCRYLSCVPFPFFSETKWWYCDDCDFVTATLYKSSDATNYGSIDLYCPGETIETIDISMDNLSSVDQVTKELPTYCRDYCNDKYN